MADIIGVAGVAVALVDVLEPVDAVGLDQALDHHVGRLFVVVVAAIVISII